MEREFLKSRSDFERNLSILAESIIGGKIHFSANCARSTDGIRKVRILPNRRIDFNTVNESARLMANTAANFDNMKDFRNNE